jgi:hypothetical protein
VPPSHGGGGQAQEGGSRLLWELWTWGWSVLENWVSVSLTVCVMNSIHVWAGEFLALDLLGWSDRGCGDAGQKTLLYVTRHPINISRPGLSAIRFLTAISPSRHHATSTFSGIQCVKPFPGFWVLLAGRKIIFKKDHVVLLLSQHSFPTASLITLVEFVGHWPPCLGLRNPAHS